jgi:hypothetical protein
MEYEPADKRLGATCANAGAETKRNAANPMPAKGLELIIRLRIFFM